MNADKGLSTRTTPSVARKQKNKAAAAKSRASKKALAKQREELIEQLTLVNASLQKRVNELTASNRQLVLSAVGMQPDIEDDNSWF